MKNPAYLELKLIYFSHTEMIMMVEDGFIIKLFFVDRTNVFNIDLIFNKLC